jgi:enoyl-CoA hydratase/carnithine racemase
MAGTDAGQDLLYEVRDGIARVTFNRPQARNALTFAMYDRLAEVCEQANQDRSIKAMLLTGAGDKAFAAGTDISQFRAFDTPQDALDYEARIDRVLGALERCRVPTVAAAEPVREGQGQAVERPVPHRLVARRRPHRPGRDARRVRPDLRLAHLGGAVARGQGRGAAATTARG